MGANVGVNRVELRPGGGHRSDAHDLDQRGDQAIFNGGHAGVVSNETGDKLFHLRITRVLTLQLPTDAAGCRCDNLTTRPLQSS